MQERYDVVVIGGGQAGLAMGYYLAQLGIRFVILDAAPVVGHSWLTRWDSLKLFTPARFSALPGLAFPAEADHYPDRDEVAGYLAGYARHFSLPVRLDEPVVSLAAIESGGYEVQTSLARCEAAQVVIATGPFQKLFLPGLARDLAPEVFQRHSSQYRTPDELPHGDVLVIGAGNSGVQIAAELARTRRTHLSVGQRLPRLPERVLGRSLFHWLDRLGAMDVTVQSRIGQRMRGKELLIGSSPGLVARKDGVQLARRATAACGDTVTMADGRTLKPSAVIWATGFRPDFRWIELPVFDGRGQPVQERGVTAMPGLYFLGLSWMHTRGSGLIGWVGRDAEFLSARIADHHDRSITLTRISASSVRLSLGQPSREGMAPRA